MLAINNNEDERIRNEQLLIALLTRHHLSLHSPLPPPPLPSQKEEPQYLFGFGPHRATLQAMTLYMFYPLLPFFPTGNLIAIEQFFFLVIYASLAFSLTESNRKTAVVISFCAWVGGFYTRRLTKTKWKDGLIYTLLGCIAIGIFGSFGNQIQCVAWAFGVFVRFVFSFPTMYNLSYDSAKAAILTLTGFVTLAYKIKTLAMPVDHSPFSYYMCLSILSSWCTSSQEEEEEEDCWIFLKIRMIGAHTFVINWVAICLAIIQTTIVPILFMGIIEEDNSWRMIAFGCISYFALPTVVIWYVKRIK